MKKLLKITGIIIVVIFALLIILPIAFKGKIQEQVKIEINKSLNAKVDFDSFHLSFIRSFPDVNLRLKNLSVINNEPFEGDTLAFIKRLSVRVNLWSFFRGSGYEIKTIHLNEPYIHIKVLEDGTASWDIELESEEDETEEVTEPSNFKLTLKRFSMSKANIKYDDKEFDIYLRLVNSNHTLRGDFTSSSTDIKVRSTNAEKLYLHVEGIPLFTGVKFDMRADVNADLDNFVFTFLDNKFLFNELEVNLDGEIAMPSSDVIMDITFGSPQTNFKSFLSLVPAVYATDFADLKTDGTLEFKGYAKGVLGAESIPGFDITLLVKNGMFQYPDLPSAVTDVNLDARLYNPGGDPDLSVLDINKFHVNLGGNTVDFTLNLKTPVSDPHIDAHLKGRIDLAKVKDFYPLEEGEALSGIVESDIKAKGRMSSIEQERYDEFLFTGILTAQNMNYSSDDFPTGVEVSEMDIRFSSRHAELRSLRSRMGDSDLSASGRIDNVLGYMLSDEMITGTFNTRSTFFNLNQLMSEETAQLQAEELKETGEVSEPVELSVIAVPANINFTLNSRFDKLIYDNLVITNANGTIRIIDETIRMQNLRMDLLEGSMILNGSYSTKNIREPKIDFKIDITRFDIQKTFNTFNTFATLAPIGKRAHGRFSANLSMASLLDENLSPVLSSLSGAGRFSSSSVKVSNSPALVKIAEQLRKDDLKEITARDVAISFRFNDGRIEVDPFDIKFGNSKAVIGGYSSFDQTINYLASFTIPRSEFGGAANEALNGLISKAATTGLVISPGENVHINTEITGTATEPKVSLNITESVSDIKDQIKDQVKDQISGAVEDVKDQVKEQVDDAKDKAREELEKRAQQVIREAERQAENIRREASVAAQKLRDEARANAQRLEDEATGPIAKAAARRTGQEMIAAADNNAKKLEDEADERASRIVAEANQRADRIRAGE